MSSSKAKEMRGVVVATDYALSSSPGGQQICTAEYIRTLEVAGFDIERVAFASANGLKEKVLRRLDRRPYRYFVPSDLADRVHAAARRLDASHIFLNTADLAPLASALKLRDPACHIVMLSHGLESVDYIHSLRTQNWRSDFSGLRPHQTLRLGQQLIEECKQRAHIDSVFCLAAFEAEIERWLGTRRLLVVPRIINRDFLDWDPIPGRIGFVGRLDHPPNLEGLLFMLDGLASGDTSGLDVRIAGAPEDFGAKLAARYPFVTYLGVIPDDKLRTEAQTWTCATNPVFCYARGASTKLAVMAGWGIPLVTTPQGERGYEWRDDAPIVCGTGQDLADAVRQLANDANARAAARRCMQRVAERSITMDEIAERVRQFFVTEIRHKGMGFS